MKNKSAMLVALTTLAFHPLRSLYAGVLAFFHFAFFSLAAKCELRGEESKLQLQKLQDSCHWQEDYWQKAKWAAGSVCPCLVATVKSHSTCQRNVIHLPQFQGFKPAPTMDTLCLEVKRGERFPLPSPELLWSTATKVPKHFSCQELLNRFLQHKHTIIMIPGIWFYIFYNSLQTKADILPSRWKWK